MKSSIFKNTEITIHPNSKSLTHLLILQPTTDFPNFPNLKPSNPSPISSNSTVTKSHLTTQTVIQRTNCWRKSIHFLSIPLSPGTSAPRTIRGRVYIYIYTRIIRCFFSISQFFYFPSNKNISLSFNSNVSQAQYQRSSFISHRAENSWPKPSTDRLPPPPPPLPSLHFPSIILLFPFLPFPFSSSSHYTTYFLLNEVDVDFFLLLLFLFSSFFLFHERTDLNTNFITRKVRSTRATSNNRIVNKLICRRIPLFPALFYSILFYSVLFYFILFFFFSSWRVHLPTLLFTQTLVNNYIYRP